MNTDHNIITCRYKLRPNSRRTAGVEEEGRPHTPVSTSDDDVVVLENRGGNRTRRTSESHSPRSNVKRMRFVRSASMRRSSASPTATSEKTKSVTEV